MGVITDLRGRTFGRLTIPANAQPEVRDGYAWWPCYCECSPKTKRWIRGKTVIAGRVVSCGCARKDPDVRRAARFVTPAKRRKEIARVGGVARHSG